MVDTFEGDSAAGFLKVDRLSKSFGARKILTDLTLEVAPSSILFLVGPSGCGKSTLLRIIAGLEAADTGDISINGDSILSVPPAKRGIGLVFQNYALWPHLNVRQHLEFALQSRPLNANEREAKILEVLEIVGLTELSQSRPAQLSGGQQQRLALARSLVLTPSLLLLDEPFSNLDLKLRRQVMRSLREIRARFNMTLIIVTHDIEAVIQPEDSIAIIESGQIAQSGSYKIVSSNPTSAFVRETVLGLEGV